jgi:hypothetical protein
VDSTNQFHMFNMVWQTFFAVSSFLALKVYDSPYHQTCHAFISSSGAIAKDRYTK